jgi:glycosyltransferase involved in cell wall biosynthesis
MNLVSIVVCTFNRTASLRATLQRCLALEPPPDGRYEVVVVDNGATDDTRAVIETFVQERPDVVRHVCERKRGLAYARNVGVRASRGSIICCTDDDCLPSTDWVAAAARAFARDERLALVGGRVELADAQDAPIGVRTGSVPLPVHTPADALVHMIGCNLSFRRHAFDRIGGYDGRFGRPGGVTGDDADFVIRALRHGLAAAYRPEVLVLHHHGRRTADAVRAAQRSYCRGRGAVYCKHVIRGNLGVARTVYWEMRQLLSRVARWRRDPPAAREAAIQLRNLFGGSAYFLSRSLWR